MSDVMLSKDDFKKGFFEKDFLKHQERRKSILHILTSVPDCNMSNEAGYLTASHVLGTPVQPILINDREDIFDIVLTFDKVLEESCGIEIEFDVWMNYKLEKFLTGSETEESLYLKNDIPVSVKKVDFKFTPCLPTYTVDEFEDYRIVPLLATDTEEKYKYDPRYSAVGWITVREQWL